MPRLTFRSYAAESIAEDSGEERSALTEGNPPVGRGDTTPLFVSYNRPSA